MFWTPTFNYVNQLVQLSSCVTHLNLCNFWVEFVKINVKCILLSISPLLDCTWIYHLNALYHIFGLNLLVKIDGIDPAEIVHPR